MRFLTGALVVGDDQVVVASGWNCFLVLEARPPRTMIGISIEENASRAAAGKGTPASSCRHGTLDHPLASSPRCTLAVVVLPSWSWVWILNIKKLVSNARHQDDRGPRPFSVLALRRLLPSSHVGPTTNEAVALNHLATALLLLLLPTALALWAGVSCRPPVRSHAAVVPRPSCIVVRDLRPLVLTAQKATTLRSTNLIHSRDQYPPLLPPPP